MKQLAVLLFCVAAVLGATRPADAISTLLGSKQITITITITPSPSPTPVGYIENADTARVVAATMAKAAAMSTKQHALHAYLLPADPLLRALAVVPIQVGDLSNMVAQATPQGSVQVNFHVKLDPTAAYFRVTPGTNPGGDNLNAGYGANSWTCVIQIYGDYTASWSITDWVYGSNKTGGTPPDNGFPTYNTTTASLLEWSLTTSGYVAYNNAGTPGETTFTHAAGADTQCINLSLNVPSTIAAGVYQTTIQYNMFVT